jgi:hypothetical protein
MKRFVLGLLGFIVVWIGSLAPQFLAYAHVSGIIILALESGVSIAGYLLVNHGVKSPASSAQIFRRAICSSRPSCDSVTVPEESILGNFSSFELTAP